MPKTPYHRAKTSLTALIGGHKELVTFVETQEQISVNSLLALGYTKRRLLSFLPQMQPLDQNRGHFGLEGGEKLLNQHFFGRF